MNLHKCILTRNDCYTSGRTITPRGVMVHSTGANNPTLRRHVQPDDGLLGDNRYDNDWNRPGTGACVHAFIIKVQDGRAITVVRALDRLERELGDLFPVIFKSITCDNGSEFANWAGIERSVWKRKGQRTTVYFCHPYTACERGTNENINRMIRRHFPKGTDFGKVTAAEVKRVERWINTYPREILGFSSSADMFAEAFGRAS